jgi:hypothetical protein
LRRIDCGTLCNWLSQQSAKHDDNEARAQLEQLRRETDIRARSIELRETEWDIAARVRERALAESREQVNLLMKELASDRAELRAGNALITDLEGQLEEHRRQLATIIKRAIDNRAAAKSRPAASTKPKAHAAPKKKRALTKRKPSNHRKRNLHG